MSLGTVIFAILFCALAAVFFYGLYLIESDKDEFRKTHGYKPKYHYRRKENNDANKDK